MDEINTDLLIIGGDADPCILRLVSLCNTYNVNFKNFLIGSCGTPRFLIDVINNNLIINDTIYKPKAVFLRPNAFHYIKSRDPHDLQSAREWFECFVGWIIGNETIKFFNRSFFTRGEINKIHSLYLAKKHGLKIADTFLTNMVDVINQLADTNEWIEKPIDNGFLPMQELKKRDIDANLYKTTKNPLTLQRKLAFPEKRIYRVGDKFLAYDIDSKQIDYRSDANPSIKPAEVPEKEANSLRAITDELGLTYAAADFKTDPKSGELCFLEVNSNPMFVAFDYVNDHKLCMGIVKYLTGSTYDYKIDI